METRTAGISLFGTLTFGSLFAVVLALGHAGALAQDGTPESEGSFSPFGRHGDRYRELYASLQENGVSHARIREIFSSEKAKKIDMTPVERMSERVIPPFRLRTEKQIRATAKMIVDHLEEYRTVYNEMEKWFGVNREIAAAILYKETALGKFDDWRHTAFPVLNSIIGFMDLPEDEAKRGRIDRIVGTARKSLAGLILYCERHGIDVVRRDFPSSFAGAVGIPQFLPMYLDYAVSHDNTVPDLYNMHDAILSLGSIFGNAFGWPGFMDLDRLSAIDGIIRKYKAYDQRKGVSFCASEHLDGDPLRRFVDEFPDIPHIAYIGRFCPTIMRYNFSSAYTLDVLQFAYHAHRIRNPAPPGP